MQKKVVKLFLFIAIVLQSQFSIAQVYCGYPAHPPTLVKDIGNPIDVAPEVSQVILWLLGINSC